MADITRYKKASQFSSLLAHPVRLMVLDMLRQSGALSVEDIRHALDIPKANLSRHLAQLRHKKFVSVRREGRNKIYELGSAHVGELCRVLHDVCDAIDHSP